MVIMAARLGDLTAHGGVITTGASSVLIGGQPAARTGDMHTCPIVVPGVGPHLGGVVASGSTTVLIEGYPASRVTDSAVCVGAVDIIVSGCQSVLIGEAAAPSYATDLPDESGTSERPFCEVCPDDPPDGE